MSDGFELEFDQKGLNNFLDQMAKKHVGQGSKILRKLTLDILGDVVLNTRWNHGVMRNNWQVSRNLKPSNTIDEGDKTGMSAIARAGRSLRVVNENDTVFIYNNLDYTEIWEDKDKMLKSAIRRNIGK